jgi:hypothetical protein
MSSSNFFKMPEKIFGVSSSLIKLFLLPFGVVVVFLMSFGLVIIPRVDSIKSLKTSIDNVRSEIKSTESKKNYLASIDQDDLVKNESYLTSAVLQEKNSYLLVGIIRNIADKYGFAVKSFSVNPVELKNDSSSLKVSDKNVAAKLPINVVLEGADDKINDLLVTIENSLPIMFIDKLNIVAKQNVSELTMTVSSYYVDNNQTLASESLSINDLIPTKEENDLLSKISQFNRDDGLTKSLSEQGSEGKDYVEYNRDDPFIL